MAVVEGIIKLSDSMTTIQNKLKKYLKIKFEKGTYKITKQLVIYENCEINLNGSTLQRRASIQSVFINRVSETTVGYSGDGNIIIKNGCIEGFGGYSYDNLVTFFHSHDIKIMNVDFVDSLCHALELNACKNVYVSGCSFLGYNLQSPDYKYRELIQIDHAAAEGFFLKKSTVNSKCYDGTTCNGINIIDCMFSKSNTRDYPYVCIGNHTQLYKGKSHENIYISRCNFKTKISGNERAAIQLIGMKNVVITNNTFDANIIMKVYSRKESYKQHSLDPVKFAKGDGVCQVRFTNWTWNSSAHGDNYFNGEDRIVVVAKTKVDHDVFISNKQ